MKIINACFTLNSLLYGENVVTVFNILYPMKQTVKSSFYKPWIKSNPEVVRFQ